MSSGRAFLSAGHALALSLLTLGALLLPPGEAAAQVYKCKGKSGETMYSEHPCDANAQPMKLREQRPATPLPAAYVPPAPEASAQTSESDATPYAGGAPDIEAARAAERECTAAATASIYGPSNDRVASYQQEMGALNEQLVGADAERSRAIQARMSKLRQAIGNENTHAHQLVVAARRRCAEQHRATP